MRLKMKKVVFATILSATLVLPVCAQESKIVAVVNKESITSKDVETRIRFICLTSNIAYSEKQAATMRPQVVQALIDEALKRQEAAKNKTTPKPDKVDAALEGMAKENGMNLKQMVDTFKKHNITKETIASRVAAQMSETQYIRAKFGFMVNVGDSEVDEMLKKINENQQKHQYSVAEISLIVSSPDQEARVRAEAQRLVGQIRSGANFHQMARQFSQDPSSMYGGDLGWLTQDQMDPELAERVKSMKDGQISDPIRTSSGFKIIRLRSHKNPGEADPTETEVTFCQVAFDVRPDSPPEIVSIIEPQINEVMQAKNIQEMKEIAGRCKANVDMSPVLKMGQLPEHLAQIATMPIGKPAQPVMTPAGLLIVALASKKSPTWTPPTREQVLGVLEQEKFAKIAAKEMMKLRSTASIEIKDPAVANVVGSSKAKA